MFSKACEYSLRAVIYLATRPPKSRRVRLQEIADAIESPVAFTAKLLQELVRKDVLVSIKGPNGGFELAGEGDEITLYQVVRAIDGKKLFEKCAIGLKECSASHPCPVHKEFVEIRDKLTTVLKSTTVNKAAGSIGKGKSFLASLSS
ncbi:MAG: Rrf2 family transcriptional regulator [Saprospirales bacterium]|nr:MAG: Rrf2 family transcriptional regulator [Saprospirales bacterium]